MEDVSLLVIKTRSHDAEGNNGRKQTICHVSSSSSNISLSHSHLYSGESLALRQCYSSYTHDDSYFYNLINCYVLFFFMVVCLNLSLSTYEQLFIIDNKLYSWNIFKENNRHVFHHLQ